RAFKAVVQRLGTAKPIAIVSLPAYDLTLTWAQDGKRLLVTKMALPHGSFETMLVDPATGEKEQLDLPVDMRVLDWSHDGKTFLVVQRRQDKKYRLGLMVQGDKKMRDLIELKGEFPCTVARFSPDNKKVVYIDADPTSQDAY